MTGSWRSYRLATHLNQKVRDDLVVYESHLVTPWIIVHGTGLETRVYGMFRSSLPFWCHTETVLSYRFFFFFFFSIIIYANAKDT